MFKGKSSKVGIVFILLTSLLVLAVHKQKIVQKERKKIEAAREDFLKDLEPIPDLKVPGIKLLSHFNENENRTSLGEFGSWDKAPEDYSQTCYDSFTPLVKRGDKGYSLRIDYDVDSENSAFNGVWFKLSGVDLSDYKSLVMWVKGDEQRKYTKHFKVEVKNSLGQKGVYYITDLTSDWKQYIIPLEKLMGLSDFSQMQELIIVFEDWRVTEKEGTIYIDDAYFTKGEILKEPLCNIYKTLRERIAKPDISKMSDKEFLELLERKAFGYFWRETNHETGLTKDKASNFKDDNLKVASIAAVGFALTSYCVAAEKGWISREEAMERTLNTLFFFRDKIENVHGFFYHFVGMENGERVWGCELSSIDTALFLSGALFAGEYFGCKVKELAQEIYERIEWDWMLGEGDTLSMGWTPENGFLTDRWNKYGEQMIMYLLAIGSPTHPIPVSSWHIIRRPIWSYEGYVCLASPPLFTHQYSHLWVDFRGKHDDYVDYFKSSVNATKANRQFCINNKFNSKSFNENSWGLTACESPAGYRAYGTPPGYANYDGTVAFTAAGGSIPFAPRECISALRWMYEHHKEYVWGKYGFVDSFNIDKSWYSNNVIGIDQGPILIMSENYLSGFIWKYFMKNHDIKRAMQDVGFKDGDMELVAEEPAQVLALYGNKEFWYKLSPEKHLEYGSITKYPQDLGCDYKVSWDEENLYFLVRVEDNEIIADEEAISLHKKDCVEIYIAPFDQTLYWANPYHFQLGFAPSGKDGKPVKYAWFQKQDVEGIKLKSKYLANGYELEISIPFAALNICAPEEDMEIHFSLAVHDFDRKDTTKNCKYNLYFVPFYEGGCQAGFDLGVLKLIR